MGPVWFRRKHRKERPAVTAPIDHSLADAAIEEAVDAHAAAQAQRTQAREVVERLHQVNLRNGFAPAIRKSFDRPIGGAL